jgi:hypothetical protein
MFRAVVIFQRPNTLSKFFYHEYVDHPVVVDIQKSFESSQGFLSKKILVNEELKFEVAMEFETFENFMSFVESNKNLIDQRNALVEEWCTKNNHSFDHRFENS